MVSKKLLIPGVLIAALAHLACGPEAPDFPTLTGQYLGQTPPGPTPEIFAPGIVSTGMHTRDVAMTPDRTEFYFGVMAGGFSVIVQTKLEGGQWTKPEVAPFSGDSRYLDIEPAISPDGQRFFFLSTRPPRGSPPDSADYGRWVNQDIWVMDRTDGGWGEPYNLGPPVNTEAPEYFPSVTRDGTLYFTREHPDTRGSYIYRSRFVDGRYDEPEILGPQVNSTNSQFNAFIAPDESYIILSTGGRDDTHGGVDYYVVFRSSDDTWSEPANLGPEVNTPRGGEWSPYVSPDGRYFFFMSSRPPSREQTPANLTFDYLKRLHTSPGNGDAAIYWMDASFLERLRPTAH